MRTRTSLVKIVPVTAQGGEGLLERNRHSRVSPPLRCMWTIFSGKNAKNAQIRYFVSLLVRFFCTFGTDGFACFCSFSVRYVYDSIQLWVGDAYLGIFFSSNRFNTRCSTWHPTKSCSVHTRTRAHETSGPELQMRESKIIAVVIATVS